ncbi:MAG: hypothetical protein AB7G75_34955 [Candidatus Binatia bacterium]
MERAYTRARELCQQMGESPHLFPVLWGMRLFFATRGEFRTARELEEQLLRLAHNVQEPDLLPWGHQGAGITLFLMGELTLAQVHLKQVIALYNPKTHGALVFRYGLDPGVLGRCVNANLLWYLGYPDQALQGALEALSFAQQGTHAFSQAFALALVASLHKLRREEQLVQERAEAAIALSSEHGFAFLLAGGSVFQGWALAEQGQSKEGIALMIRGLGAWQATGAQIERPYFLAILAETYGKTGQAEDALKVVKEAMACIHETGQRNYEAELYRLKGELTLRAGEKGQREKGEEANLPNPTYQSLNPDPHGEAEACFLKAIDIARQQHAKSWELRAATSLARLWQQQDKRAEAHTLLSEVYTWFTEGFETKDLQEAKALIEELGD